MECPSCRASVPEGSRFCPSCGHALSARAEERRIITVLFADLVGFTTFSEHADPEQLKNIVDAAFQRLVADIAAHGGRVDKIVGDQIMALFGAPIAHEDDAERSVRAGLQMQATLQTYAEEMGIPVRMRIGLNTGEVLVGALRAGGEYTAMGDTVNVASRLQTCAQAGQVLVGPMTHAATAGVVRYEALGAVEARGRGGLVDAFLALETLAPPGHRPRRRRTPLLGREQEMAMLCPALGMAFERRRPQLLFLAGEAGIGKTRVAEELASTAAQEYSATVLEGRCVPYGEANVWWPVAMAIRHALGIDVHDTPDETAEKTRSKVSWGLDLPLDSTEVQHATDGLCYLLGLPTALDEMEPVRAREVATDSFVGLLQNMAGRKPLVFSVSEVHWADPLVLDLLEELPDRLRGYPFVLVATSRLELSERWAPRQGRHNLVALHLDPLDRTASEALVVSLLEGAAPADLVEAVLERSGGNPFFLEELAGLVHGAEAPDELPATLRALVAARLDNLPAPERRLLDHAAVVGRLGTVEVLAALGGSTDAVLRRNLDALVSRDLLSLEDGKWQFRSDLVREVAYETLTKGERARSHARVGAFLSTGRETQQLEALAHHFGMAAQLDAELGGVEGVPTDTLDEAIHWIGRSVDQTEERETPSVTVRLCSRALELLPDGRGSDRRRFLVRRARAHTMLVNLAAARTDISEVFKEAEQAGDEWALAAARTALGYVEQREGSLHESASDLDEAINRWRALSDRAGEADARRLRGMTDLFLGRLGSAEANLAEALVLFKALGDRRGEAWALQNMAWISVSGGDIPEANRRVDEAIDLFGQIGDIAGLSWGYGLLAWVRLQEGFLEEAEELAHRVLSTRRSGDAWAEGMMHMLIATTSLWLGRTDAAITAAEGARGLFESIADSTGELRATAVLVRALLAAGQIERARELGATVETMAKNEIDPDGRVVGHLVAGTITVQLGESSHSLALGELLEPPTQGMGGTESEVSAGLALLQIGRAVEAEALLSATFDRAATPGARHAVGAALMIAHPAAGSPGAALGLATKLMSEDHGTYLDRIGAAIGSGLAHVQRRDATAGATELARAVEIADGTGDRLSQALSRLARAVGLEVLGEPAAATVRADADARLASLRLGHTDWEPVFRRAAGAL